MQKGREKVLYTYDLASLESSKKVRAVYILKGRNKEKGIVKEMNGEFLANGCFMLPLKHDKEMQEIMKKWNIRFKRRTIMLID